MPTLRADAPASRRGLAAACAALALPFLLAACGQAGPPTKAEILQVVRTAMQSENQKTSDRSLGLFSGPYDPADLSITNADCTARDNGVYRCAVTAVTKAGTNTANLSFKKVDGTWTLVQNEG
ncbi:hypothetical protein HLH34_08825 [Gluconacetobacter azotocaptans]|uniref:Ig-like domain-containing protein n=1 Tax=Gluconacetobacter azotocaptans TaxID=142834 RepID=A0A7W4JSI7_9PROT|nr:hypothetical protein [Gluconacetobacter azotocaptans]MBB2190072.1 hypothetical protein [Gluconacetobacter azotocaptans]MBM9402804.1 hypothetical protein [Gluconacetobacter azotocaptans]GBQ26073.1 hypothetical protein AA13594_0124 [Gluconacetobacter azotocaptans DSM 13594]